MVEAAWKHRQRTRRKPDCSHLVHQIYHLAGLPYPYATSQSLFAGAEPFVRVKKPQPGDLVVWRGHVGIVVDPKERSFYSSLSTGLRVESYDSRYWRGRRPVRFYRYRRPGPGRIQLAGAGPPTAFAVPSSILIATSGSKPEREDIAAAIAELSQGAAGILRGGDLSQIRVPVVIFDQLYVERAKVKSKRGWARVRIHTHVSVRGGQIKRKQRREKRRWELRRTEAGWQALKPSDRVYVPHAMAVRALAEQLELLTRPDVSAPDPTKAADQSLQIVRLLLALLEDK